MEDSIGAAIYNQILLAVWCRGLSVTMAYGGGRGVIKSQFVITLENQTISHHILYWQQTISN